VLELADQNILQSEDKEMAEEVARQEEAVQIVTDFYLQVDLSEFDSE
jgi:hypothetical protein